jgi:hypothetical protein
MPRWLKSLLRALLPALLDWICPACGKREKRMARYDDNGDEVSPRCLRCNVAMKRAPK